jgi:trans-aconitate methyltransferase
MAIAGYLMHGRAASILDVGCGKGRLRGLLSLLPLRRYVGLDFSPAAVEAATREAFPSSTFLVADMHEWTSEERFDAIVFNEVIYCSSRPAEVLARYAGMLVEGGHLVVSVFENSAAVWEPIEAAFETVDLTRVTNAAGATWQVRLLKKR